MEKRRGRVIDDGLTREGADARNTGQGAREQAGFWRQFKGDPAIRGHLFAQQRVRSPMDEHMTEVLSRVDELLCHHGVFHVQLNFAGAWVMLWTVDDPYGYRLYVLDELISPDICLALPARRYPPDARVPPLQIDAVMNQFRALRQVDDNIYLRAASLNVMNGLVGLTFSCDGTHYMAVDEFLRRELSFWSGRQAGYGALT